MNSNQHIWQKWADALHRWRLSNLTGIVLESTGSLNLLGAQVVYLGQPLLSQFLPKDHLNALAEVLENPEQTQAFIVFLRQENRSD
ncbi:MAG: hypothetical protein U9Q82_12325 [Chloroflexota bacterium]|nr:hypothetical protein [Chloroflexota bacterium]